MQHHAPLSKLWLVTLAAFVGTSVSSVDAAGDKSSDKPNIIIVYCDNLGYGDIEPFGSTLHRTPNLTRMAQEGRKFTHFCVTAGVCTPSRASIMTGCYAQRVGMHLNPRDGWVLRPLSQYGLHPDEITVAEVLRDRGYATAIVGKWHLGDQPEFLPTRQGFDWFFGVPYSDDMTERVWDQDGSHWPPLPLMENESVIEAPCDRNGLTRRYTERAMNWIAEHKNQPFFLYFPQAMPGSTSTPFSSAEFKGRSRNGPWGDAIEELDWSMGMMLDQLKQLGIAEKTLVIWTSDNGAPINRNPTDLSRGSNRPLHGRGYTTSEGAFRVPTIVWQPGKVPAGTTCDELASTMDLLPTFAKLAGGNLPGDRKIDGHDIAPLLYGQAGATTPHKAYYYYHQDQLQAVRSGPWKMFLPLEGVTGHPHLRAGQKPETLLFNVVDDVSCEQNVAARHPAIIASLTQLAENARQDLGDKGKPGKGQRPAGKIAGKPQPQVMQKNALDVIEGVRGGRHWVDEKTAPPKSPADSLACLQIEPGLEIQLVASEPLVRDPVAITFDQRGRMFVVEYGDYPIGPEDGGDPLSRVVYLEDTDGDGHVDKRHVFADKLTFAHSLMPFQGGLIVGAQTQILFLKDTDGDNIADVRKVLFDGFTPAHPQMQIGNPRWGIDNWIYLNYGPGNITSPERPADPVVMPRKEFRFNPLTFEFEADSGLGQFGNTIDRWGNRFYCTNRNPIMTTLLTPAVLQRNPFAVNAAAHYDVGTSGGDTRVYPLVEMKSNYLSHAGTHTSACGVTAYTGHLLGGSFQNSVFVCEPIGHLVTRSIIRPDGLRLTAERARPKSDFLASTDTWFRPASLANGPDGALYLADMYRLWVEHPKFLPPEIAAQLDWRAGDDRGRIYRIVPQNAKPQSFTPPQDDDDMVALLESPNGWKQYLGQQLLAERSTPATTQSNLREITLKLQRLARDHSSATTRLHAIWTLNGISALTRQDVLQGMKDGDSHVRHDAVRLTKEWIDDDGIFSSLRELSGDDNASVRFQVALALGESARPEATHVLASLAFKDGEDPWFVSGLLTSTRERSGAIISELTANQKFATTGDASKGQLIKQLATVVGARCDVDELATLLKSFAGTPSAASESSGVWWRAAAISGLGQGLPRYRGDLGRMSLPLLLSNHPERLASAASGMDDFLSQSQKISLDRKRPAADRAAAIELLAWRPFADAAPAFAELLESDQPAEVQTACISALSANGSEAAARIVLDRWQVLGPALRDPALNLLLRRDSSTRLALDAMTAGTMQPSALSIDHRVRLLKHSDAALRAQATKLFGGAVSSNRLAVAKQYQTALSLNASAEEGAKVFEKTCSKCHRINGKGHEVGPDLSDVRNRSHLALLYDILDPNSKVEPRFSAYTVVTIDGKLFNGLIVSESDEAVVLRMAEGKQQTIGRGEIEVMRASTVSLMPEGVEKDVTPQNMADLLEFLKKPQ
ncbi:MAG: sulfatase-like hydrolase/transferase [Planctomycetota bacterium]|nr:sulfatase-like hydrolase/transferase [Planctomycetota bacterium]